MSDSFHEWLFSLEDEELNPIDALRSAFEAGQRSVRNSDAALLNVELMLLEAQTAQLRLSAILLILAESKYISLEQAREYMTVDMRQLWLKLKELQRFDG